MPTLKSNMWWTRLADRLRSKPRRVSHDLPDIGEDGLLSDPVELMGPTDGETLADKPSALSRWTKRDQTLAKLQEGYERVTQVVEEVQKHLAMQGERTERICTSLEQLARSMSDLPTVSRQQAQTLESIAGQLEMTNAHTQQLAETIGEIPKSTRIQSETLAGIKRQLDMSCEQHLVTSQTMDKLGSAIGMLGESSHAQLQTLSTMHTRAGDQQDLLAGLIARQSKRFMMLFVVTVLLAAAAIAATVVGVMMRHQM